MFDERLQNMSRNSSRIEVECDCPLVFKVEAWMHDDDCASQTDTLAHHYNHDEGGKIPRKNGNTSFRRWDKPLNPTSSWKKNTDETRSGY